MKKFRDNKGTIALANAFSGGVFLSLAFGHMIPHSQHGFEHLVGILLEEVVRRALC